MSYYYLVLLQSTYWLEVNHHHKHSQTVGRQRTKPQWGIWRGLKLQTTLLYVYNYKVFSYIQYFGIIQNYFFTMMYLEGGKSLFFQGTYCTLNPFVCFQPPASLILSLCVWSSNFSFLVVLDRSAGPLHPLLRTQYCIDSRWSTGSCSKDTVLNCGVSRKELIPREVVWVWPRSICIYV